MDSVEIWWNYYCSSQANYTDKLEKGKNHLQTLFSGASQHNLNTESLFVHVYILIKI